MKAYLDTSITGEVKVYDSEQTEPGLISRILAPVIIIRDDNGNELFTYGEPSAGINIGAVLVFLLALVLAFKMIR